MRLKAGESVTKPARLYLQTGEGFAGRIPVWQDETVFGEAVFNTGMVGYVEAATDPSYAGQLLTFTYPLIGNYGVPAQAEWESDRAQAAAIIVSEAAPHYAHRLAESDLATWCRQQHLPLMTGVDTRALAKTLSRNGVTAAAIVSGDDLDKKPSQFIDINTRHLAAQACVKAPVEYGDGAKTVIAVDCGIKQNILRHLRRFPVKIRLVPCTYDFTGEDYDAVFISNGPGDPQRCAETVAVLQKVLRDDKPVFGICLGAQLMALAAGARTRKLRFGHRAQNHPCLLAGGERCLLTSQNHGYCIEEESLPIDWQVLFRHLNDGTVQGIRHRDKPFFAVQFHPEAAPGPVDSEWLFDTFYRAVADGGELSFAAPSEREAA